MVQKIFFGVDIKKFLLQELSLPPEANASRGAA